MKTSVKIAIAVLLVAMGVACRLLPHPYNFAPIAGVALFSGAYLGARYALTLPLISMLIGDIFIGFYSLPLMVAVYGCFVVAGIIGLAIRNHRGIETVAGASIASSLIFFAVTNGVIWKFSPWYSHDFTGLIQCYTLALPFLRNTLVGDLLYTGMFFGAYELVRFLVCRRKLALNPQ